MSLPTERPARESPAGTAWPVSLAGMLRLDQDPPADTAAWLEQVITEERANGPKTISNELAEWARLQLNAAPNQSADLIG